MCSGDALGKPADAAAMESSRSREWVSCGCLRQHRRARCRWRWCIAPAVAAAAAIVRDTDGPESRDVGGDMPGWDAGRQRGMTEESRGWEQATGASESDSWSQRCGLVVIRAHGEYVTAMTSWSINWKTDSAHGRIDAAYRSAHTVLRPWQVPLRDRGDSARSG